MSTALVDIQAAIKAQLEMQKQTVEPPSSNKISTKGKVFTMPDGTTHPGPMRAIVLDYRTVHQYYKGIYNPQDPKPPICFAVSKLADGIKPSDNCEEKQAEQCSKCTFNEWGSAATGRGKACKNSMRLAIVPENPDADTEVMTLNVSPTGLKSFNAMVNKLTTAGLMPAQIITEISFNPNEQYPQLVFKAEAPHDYIETVWPLREAAQAVLDRDAE